MRKFMNENKLSLVFTGDIGFDKYMDGKWNDEDLISPEVIDFLHGGDHVIANVEGPISRQDKKPVAGSVMNLMHTIDPGVTKVLLKMNADIWNINNNHIMDAGPEGVSDTLKEAASFGAAAVGAGMNIEEAAEPLVIDCHGVRKFGPDACEDNSAIKNSSSKDVVNSNFSIGIFSVGYRRGCKPAGEDMAGCLLWNDMERIQENINKIKKSCRWCVIISHGGEEFTSLPSPYTRDRYLEFLNMGADLIVCHHPHVPMNYELFDSVSGSSGRKAIFYSLGNFIFDTDYQRAQFNTEKGVLLKLVFSENDFSFEAMGIEIDRTNEHIVKAPLPKIFCDVPDADYKLLSPLAAKMFVAATKRQQIYLNKDKFTNATEEEWAEHFADPKRSGRVPGEALDFFIVCPLAEKEKENDWMESDLEDVKEYILEQL